MAREVIGEHAAVVVTGATLGGGAVAGGEREPDSERPPPLPLATPSYWAEGGSCRWDWGLGLGPEDRKKVVCKQGDMLWKSVPGNLATTTVWFVEEVGLSWDEMRKVSLCERVILVRLSIRCAQRQVLPIVGFP